MLVYSVYPVSCHSWKLTRLSESEMSWYLMSHCDYLLLLFYTELSLNAQGEVLQIAANQCCPECVARTPGSCHHEEKIHGVSVF